MLPFNKTEKYPIDRFIADMKNASVTEKELARKGFIKKDGYFLCAKKTKKYDAYVVIELENAEYAYSYALAVKNFLDFYHISNIGILLVCDIVKECDEILADADVLFLRFNATEAENVVPYDNVYTGVCKYTVSPYPSVSPQILTELFKIATSFGLDCKVLNGKLEGEEYFAFLYQIEQKLLDFSAKTADFDKINSTMSRIIIDAMTLPVVSSEYYCDLFSFIKRKEGKVNYNGCAGCILGKNNGIFIDVNVNTEKNTEDLYKCLKVFTEDING